MMEKRKGIAEQFKEFLEANGVDPSLPFRRSLVDDLEVEYVQLPAPAKDAEETDTDYFNRLLDYSEKAKEATKMHETWKRRHMEGLRELDCKHRILIFLGELLKSDGYSQGGPRSGFKRITRAGI